MLIVRAPRFAWRDGVSLNVLDRSRDFPFIAMKLDRWVNYLKLAEAIRPFSVKFALREKDNRGRDIRSIHRSSNLPSLSGLPLNIV